ncbi:MAG: phospholipase D-like domain-containing protein [Candidatus Micrarchaeota archaeon]|nr:phospholipase D-like domain-containing protein [Candidatus Micrarchaeota archaeon]
MGQKDCKKERIAIALLILIAAALALYILLAPSAPCAGCNAIVSFVFSPKSEGRILSLIGSASRTIDIEMYVLTSNDVISALSDAQKRGVRVRVIMEPRIEDSRKQRVFEQLRALGIEVRWASLSYKLTHSKFMIIDGKKALVGSINFSESALNSNREAAVIVEGEKVRELAAVFEEDWQKAQAGAKQGESS